MVDPLVVVALNGLASLCGRDPLNDSACALYAKAVNLSASALLQIIVDWVRINNEFPQPADLLHFALSRPATPEPAEAGQVA